MGAMGDSLEGQIHPIFDEPGRLVGRRPLKDTDIEEIIQMPVKKRTGHVQRVTLHFHFAVRACRARGRGIGWCSTAIQSANIRLTVVG
jgi:hypothetical protein